MVRKERERKETTRIFKDTKEERAFKHCCSVRVFYCIYYLYCLYYIVYTLNIVNILYTYMFYCPDELSESGRQ